MAETIERTTRLEEQMKNVIQKVEDLDDKVDEVSKKLDGIFDKLDTRYASKLTEKIVYAIIGMILSGVVLALLSLIIRK